MMRRTLAVVVLALAFTGCGGDDGTDTPSASLTTPPTSERTTTTTALTPEEEVEQAYLRSWEVYAEAVRDLDTSGLEESYAGEQLERTRAEVEQLRADGHAVEVSVEHDYRIQIVDPDLAVVQDRYRNHSILIDAASGEPLEEDPDDLYFETYTLRESGGRWKVVDIVRESHTP
jgi:hypothetical protein